jgi:WD40 repeat protein
MQSDTQKNVQLKRYFPAMLLVMLTLITILVVTAPNQEAPETVGMIVSEQQPSRTVYPSSTAKPSATAQKPTQTPHYINTPTRTPTAYENQFVKIANLGEGVMSSVFRSPQNEIAMILKDGVIHWYNGESLEPLGSIGVEDNNLTSISEVVFSRDNRLAAIGVPFGGYIIDLEHEELVQRAYGGWYGSEGFVFSPENRFVASLTRYSTTGGPYHSISVYSMETRKLIFDPAYSDNIYSTLLPDRYHSMSPPSISPDGTLLAAGHSDYRVYVWELETGNIRYLLEGHAADVASVNFSPDGRLLASGSRDGTVRLWTTANGQLSRVITGFKDNVTEVRFSEDGRYLHVGVRSQPDSIYDLATGKLSEQPPAVQPTLDPLVRRSHLEGYLEETWPIKVRLSPDERRLAVSGNSHILVWDIEHKNLINSLEAPGIGAMEVINFSPNGEYLAGVSRNGDILIWSVKSDEPLLFFDSDDLSARQTHTQPARAYSQSIFDNKDVTFSPDSSQFLFTNGIDLELWDVRTAAHVLTLEAVQPPAYASRLSFSGDGERIYALLDNNQKAGVWDAYSGKLIHEVELTALKLGAETYFGLHEHLFSRNNQDDQTSWIELWNLESGEMLRLVKPDRFLRYLIFSPDGSRLTSLSGNIIYHWSTDTGKLIGRFEQKDYISDYDINADGSSLALWNQKNVDLFQIHALAPVNPSEATPTLAPLPTRVSPEVQLPPDAMTISDANRISQLARFREGTIDHITWSPDSTKVWASGSMGTFNYSFTPNSEVLPLGNRSESVGWVAQSIQLPGGQVLGAGTAAGRVQVWDTQTGEVLFDAEGSQPALSSNGEQLVYQRPDYHLQIVHLQDGSLGPIFTNASEYSQYSRLPVFSPDGSLVAAVSANSSRLKYDDSIRVWNVHTGEIFNALGGPDHDIVDLSFSS